MIDFTRLYAVRKDLNDAIRAEDVARLSKIVTNENFNLNYIDKNGQSPLHMCCTIGNLEIIKILVDNGASIHLINRNGWYPIHLASYHGFVDVVLYLIEASMSLDETEFSSDLDTTDSMGSDA
jgi:ankyrin repeat protein